jgi:hypothetical protein
VLRKRVMFLKFEISLKEKKHLFLLLHGLILQFRMVAISFVFLLANP